MTKAPLSMLSNAVFNYNIQFSFILLSEFDHKLILEQ